MPRPNWRFPFAVLIALTSLLAASPEKIAGPLREIAEGASIQTPLKTTNAPYARHFATKADRVVVDLTVLQGLADAENAVRGLPGVTINGIFSCPGYSVISVIADPSQLNPMAAISQVTGVLPVVAFTDQDTGGQGSVTSEALAQLRVERLRDFFPAARGGGIRIGVISDSVGLRDGVEGGAIGIAESQATGDLPAGDRVQVLMEMPSDTGRDPSDEGRAMMELIYDLVPDVDRLVFATGVAGEGTFAQNIQRLADAGCQVIVDDIRTAFSPNYQPGLISHSIRHFVNQRGGVYLCSAGNYARNSYERPFTDEDFDTLHDIELGKSEIAADIADGATISVELQWAEAVGSVNKDYVIELIDRGSRVMLANTGYINNLIIQRPVDYLVWENNTGKDVLAALRIRQVGGSPLGRPMLRLTGLKHQGDVTIHFPGMYRTATVSPHGSEPTAMAIAAAPATDPFTPESFSSHGPARWLFDAFGQEDPQPETLAKPDFMSLDGCSNSFFGRDNMDGMPPRFFGTSAAAPNAAAVAALTLNVLRQHLPSADGYDVRAAFMAAAPNRRNHSTVSGHGLVTALAAGFAARQPSPPTATLYPAPSGKAVGEFLLVDDLSISSFRVRFAQGGNVGSRWEEVLGVFRPLVALHDATTGEAISVNLRASEGALVLEHGSVASKHLVFNVATSNRRTASVRFRAELTGPPVVATPVVLGGGNNLVTNGMVSDAEPLRAFSFQVPPGNGGRFDVRLTPAGFRGRLMLYSDEDTLESFAATNAGVPVIRSWEYGVPGNTVYAQVAADNFDGAGNFTIEFTWNPDPILGAPPALGSNIAITDYVVRPNPVSGIDSYAPSIQVGAPKYVLWNPNSFDGSSLVLAPPGETVSSGLYSYTNFRRFLAGGPGDTILLDPAPPAGMAVGQPVLQLVAAVGDVAPPGVDTLVLWEDPPTPVELPFDGMLDGTLMSHERTGAIDQYGLNHYYKYTVPESFGGPTTITLTPSSQFNAAMNIYSEGGGLLAVVNGGHSGQIETAQVLGSSEEVFHVLVRSSVTVGNILQQNQLGTYKIRFETVSTGLPGQLNIAPDARVSIARPAPGSGLAYGAYFFRQAESLLTVFVPATDTVRMGAGTPGDDGLLYGGLYGAARQLLHNPPVPASFIDFPVTVTAGQQHFQQIVAYEDLEPFEEGFEVERFLVTPQFVEDMTPTIDGTTWSYVRQGTIPRVGTNRYYRFTMPPTGSGRATISVVATDGLDVGFTVWTTFDLPLYQVDAYGANAQELLANSPLSPLGGTFVLHVHSGKDEGALDDPALRGRFELVILAASAGDVPPLPTGTDGWIIR
ncbi:MAG: S8 family serine peptidase [Candidatus Sumerlaeia bacterium]|nr:S8 family serine peptidase [Candidatus Sumerlaeia bacterium]